MLAGIFYLLGVIGADLCYAPNELIMSFISSPDLNYFLSCATNPNVPPAPALSMIGSVVDMVAGGINQLSALGDQVDIAVTANTPAGYGPLIIGGAKNGAFAAANTNLKSAVDSLLFIPNTLLGCQQVDALFSRLWDGLCNGTVTSAIGIARVLIAAGVFMLLQMAVGIDLCCYHPGDARAWVDGGMAASKVASSEAPAAAAAHHEGAHGGAHPEGGHHHHGANHHAPESAPKEAVESV